MYKRYIFIASLCLHACLFSASNNPSPSRQTHGHQIQEARMVLIYSWLQICPSAKRYTIEEHRQKRNGTLNPAPSALSRQMMNLASLDPAIACIGANPSAATNRSSSEPSTPLTEPCILSPELTPTVRPNDGRVWRYNPYNLHSATEFEKKP